MTERSDVLIIGGGMAGAWAAIAATQAGASVTLVEKGYCGTSGVTASAGPGHWWAPPDPASARQAVVEARLRAGQGLGDGAWMHRILDMTWRTLPTLAPEYQFPRTDDGETNYRALRGPEYMRALRARLDALGVRVLDHHPALELLAWPDGSIAGARGIRRQHGNSAWEIHAGAVVLAAGGTAFLSGLLGSRNNTGDGYLMAAEAGAELSGMEFTAAFTIAPAHSNMTRTMSYAFATYYDADGQELEAPPSGPAQTRFLARALQNGPVLCSLHRLPDDIKVRLHRISPNVPLVFDRWGIDPFRDRFPITLHTDGTIRGLGGVRTVGENCETAVPGLYVAGDNAAREHVAGAISGGGNVNSAWALSSGLLAGRAATARARRLGLPNGRPVGLGRAGLRPSGSALPVDLAPVRAAMRREMRDFDRALFRSADGLEESRRSLDAQWDALAAHAQGDDLKTREAAALLATARWSVASALARQESRGMHLRVDAPEARVDFTHRLLSGGLEDVWTRWDNARVQQPALETVA
jgi:L-aspartate oxidase